MIFDLCIPFKHSVNAILANCRFHTPLRHRMRLIQTGTGLAAIIVLLAVLYFLPGIIAWLYRRERAGTIFLVNALAGWTLVGWVAALIWSTNRDVKPLEELHPEPHYRAQKWLIVAVSVAGLVLALQIVRVYVLNSEPRSSVDSTRALDPTTVRLTRYEVRKDPAGLTAKGSFTIRNNNSFRVKDVVVKCVHATIDGTLLDSTTVTLNHSIEPFYDLRITDVDMGAIPGTTANSSCATTGFTPQE